MVSHIGSPETPNPVLRAASSAARIKSKNVLGWVERPRHPRGDQSAAGERAAPPGAGRPAARDLEVPVSCRASHSSRRLPGRAGAPRVPCSSTTSQRSFLRSGVPRKGGSSPEISEGPRGASEALRGGAAMVQYRGTGGRRRRSFRAAFPGSALRNSGHGLAPPARLLLPVGLFDGVSPSRARQVQQGLLQPIHLGWAGARGVHCLRAAWHAYPWPLPRAAAFRPDLSHVLDSFRRGRTPRRSDEMWHTSLSNTSI